MWVSYKVPEHQSTQLRKGPKYLAARREPSALEGWILEVLYCNPQGSRAFLRILSTEGRGIRLCWALSKFKDLNANHAF